MNAGHDLERRVADHYASEAPPRAPDRVLGAVLETIDHTPQRRVLVRVPRRSPSMNMFARVAVAAVALIAVGALGAAVLRPGGGTGGAPVATPPASPSPSPSPTPSAEPSPSPYVKPELTGTFSSDFHGFSISYPEGWLARAATEPWTTDSFPKFQESSADFMYDPARTDHLFLGVASQPLAGRSPDSWAAGVLAQEDCRASEPVTVDGAEGILGDCGMAAVATGDRGYALVLYVSADDPELSEEFYFLSWFAEEIVPTVDLRPEDAVDVVPSSSP